MPPPPKGIPHHMLHQSHTLQQAHSDRHDGLAPGTRQITPIHSEIPKPFAVQVFSQRSQLYQPGLVGRVTDYYDTNASALRPEVNRNGFPLGFFHEPLAGFADG